MAYPKKKINPRQSARMPFDGGMPHPYYASRFEAGLLIRVYRKGGGRNEILSAAPNGYLRLPFASDAYFLIYLRVTSTPSADTISSMSHSLKLL